MQPVSPRSSMVASGCRAIALAIPALQTSRTIAHAALAFALLVPAAAFAQTTYTWTGGGSDSNWGTAANWSGGTAPSGDSGNNVLVFSGSTRTSPTNNLTDWTLGVGQLEFASGAASFTLGGNPFGFRPYLGSQPQQIFQNSANTQTIGVNGFSFRPESDSQINLNAGDLVISSSNMYIDMNADAWRQLFVTGNDSTRRTLTFSGNVNRGNTGSGNKDPDIVIRNNKRVLVTGSLNNGTGNDASIFIDSGVLEFGSTGAMTGGSPAVGATSGSGTAAVYLNSAGSTFARQLEIRGGSSGQRIVGGLNTSGTVTYSGNFISTNSPGDYDLKAATGGATDFTGTRNFNAGLFVNRPDAATYGGTVILSGTTSSDSFTALLAGTLQISDLNQIGTGHFEFFADSGDSGTLRYTGGSATTTRTLWIDNPGITRAAIDVSQAGATLTWNPGDGNINQNLTKAGAGTLVFGGSRLTGSATVGVEAGRLVLTGSNSYSGGSTVSGGTLEVSGNGSAGGSASGLGMGTVSIGSNGQVTWYLSTNNQHTITNAFSLSGGTLYTEDGANTFSGRVTLASGSSTIAARYEDTITLSGGLAGAGSVLFTQAGGTGSWAAPTYVLSASGSNTGTVRVTGSSGGGATKLQLAHVNALQNATLDLATGDQGSVEFTVAGTNTYALGGLQGSRNLAIGGNSLSVGGNGSSTTYTGVLSGSGGFTKVGAGTLTLGGTNSYSGGTVVSAGRLVGTTASLQGAITNNAAVTFDMATSGTYDGRMTGSGSLTKVGAGTLVLTNTTVYTGATALDAGVIALASMNALQATGTISFGGGTLQYSASNTLDYSDRFSTAAGQQYRIDTNGQNIAFMRSISSAGGSFVKLGAGSLQLAGTSSYTGGTIVSAGEFSGRIYSIQGDILNNAIVRFLGSDAGSYGGAMSGTGALYTQIPGELVLAGTNTYSGGTVIFSSGKIRGSTSGVQGAIQNAGIVEFAQPTAGTYAGVISGTGSVTKSGAGVLSVTAANTYTGLTSVIDGELKLNGSIAGGLNVALIAALSGTGTVGGNATIIGSHAPGNSPGAQTFNANLTYEAGAVVNWELIANTTGSAGVNYDQIILPTGNLSFSGSTTLALSFNNASSAVDWSDPFWNVNRAWVVYDLSGGSTSGLSNLTLGGSLLDTQGDALSPTERGYFTTSLSGQDVVLQFTAVPEPATSAMAVAGLACGGYLVRRRRKRA